MKYSIRKIVLISATILSTSTAFSAAYMKLGDIKGEAHQPTASQNYMASPQGSQGLLVPAVQKVREAAAQPQAANLSPEQAAALRKAIKENSRPCGLNSNKPC